MFRHLWRVPHNSLIINQSSWRLAVHQLSPALGADCCRKIRGNQWSGWPGGPGDEGMTQQMTAANRAVTRVTEADQYRAYILLLFSLFWVLERKVVDLFCGLLWCDGYNNLIHTRVRVMCKISIIWRKRVTSDFPGRQWPQAGSRAGPHTSRSPSQHLLILSPTFTREKHTLQTLVILSCSYYRQHLHGETNTISWHLSSRRTRLFVSLREKLVHNIWRLFTEV